MPTLDEILDYLGGPHITIELFLAVLFTVLVIRYGDGLPLRRLRNFDRRFHQFARNHSRAMILVFVLALFGRIALLPVLPVPEPHIHDEFSYMLAADTFASGRLTNPSPAGWQHFETFHVIVQPRYMSIYPPGQGLMLAAGEKVGHPWIGVLVTAALMCAGLTWALQAWFSPGWALLGGILAVLRLGWMSYWVNAYWGGALAGLGCVLVLGAFGRFLRSPRVWHGITAGLGAIILAATRPYEGLLVCIAVGVVAMYISIRRGCVRTLLTAIALPTVVIVGMYVGFLGYYNKQGTGSATTMPYVLDAQQYSATPWFFFQRAHTHGPYRHPVMAGFYAGWEFHQYLQRRDFWFSVREKVMIGYRFFFQHALLLPLLFGLATLGHRRTRPLIAVGALCIPGLLLQVFMQPHYLAVVLVILYAIVLCGMRRLRCWPSRHNPKGLLLVWSVVLICVFMIALDVSAWSPPSTYFPIAWDTLPGGISRRAIITTLNGIPGDHLVFVHYRPTHEPHQEWVYNEADLQRAKIIWAREIDEQSDSALVREYPGRHVWRLQADENPPFLEPDPGMERVNRASPLTPVKSTAR